MGGVFQGKFCEEVKEGFSLRREGPLSELSWIQREEGSCATNCFGAQGGVHFQVALPQPEERDVSWTVRGSSDLEYFRISVSS